MQISANTISLTFPTKQKVQTINRFSRIALSHMAYCMLTCEAKMATKSFAPTLPEFYTSDFAFE